MRHPIAIRYRAACAITALAVLAPLAACRNAPADPVSIAAAAGDVSRVRQLVAAGSPANGPADAKSWTPMAWAAREGRPATIRQLVQLGADPNARDPHGTTPLLQAIEHNQVAAARALLDAGADPNLRADDGPPPLIAAAAMGYAPIVQALLEAGADPAVEVAAGNALSAAIGGIPTIQNAASGTCHPETVRRVLDAAPRLKLPKKFPGSAALWFARRGNCQAVLKMMEGR
jgi:ankyrin repeat protein